MHISIICAMSQNGIIGNKNKIPWHLPEDLKIFKTITMGKPVIMGRKTFTSILKTLGTPLPGRKNIVLTRKSFIAPDNVNIVADCKAALTLAAQDNTDEVFIAGGGQIYKEFLPLATKMYLSIVEGTYKGDTYFPNFNEQEWQEIVTQNKPGFVFKVLQRI